MVFRDHENQLVMIDHPQFDPVFDFMEREGMRLMGHLGEPRNCWPLEEMTVKNEGSSQYHMYLHPAGPCSQRIALTSFCAGYCCENLSKSRGMR